MRIVAGRHRGRSLKTPDDLAVRPTADRTREALFNIIEHGHFRPGGGSPIRGAHVLDAFAGTGAMGLEALSRGAESAVFMENGRAALEALERNVAACREAARAVILRVDATRPPAAQTHGGACAIAFLDPPYRSGLAAAALAALAQAGWLATGALCSVELAATEDFVPPEGFESLDERRYGAAKLMLLRYGGE